MFVLDQMMGKIFTQVGDENLSKLLTGMFKLCTLVNLNL